MKFVMQNAGRVRPVGVCALLALTIVVIGALGGIHEGRAQSSQVVSLPRCRPGQIVAVDLSTGTTNGVKNPLGSTDPKWHLTMVADYSGPPGNWTAYSIASFGSPWMPNPSTGANWIQRFKKPINPGYAPEQNSAPGAYRYIVPFNLNLASYSSVAINGRFASDNEFAIIKLNSNWILLGSVGFVNWEPFSIAPSAPGAPFINGGNKLDFLVDNTGGPTGLIVDAKLQARCKRFDLTIQKNAVNTPWQVGGQGTFNIVVHNFGGDSISQGTVVMEDLLPLGFQPPFTISQQGSLWNCSTIPVGLQYKLTCTWPTNIEAMAVGPLPLVSITGTVRSLAQKNCATVKLTGSLVPETNVTNNASCIKVNRN